MTDGTHEDEIYNTKKESYLAYAPEYLVDGEWQSVSLGSCTTNIPRPLLHEEINSLIGLCDFNHAHDIGSSTVALDRFNGRKAEYRLAKYRVECEVRAIKVD